MGAGGSRPGGKLAEESCGLGWENASPNRRQVPRLTAPAACETPTAVQIAQTADISHDAGHSLQCQPRRTMLLGPIRHRLLCVCVCAFVRVDAGCVGHWPVVLVYCSLPLLFSLRQVNDHPIEGEAPCMRMPHDDDTVI